MKQPLKLIEHMLCKGKDADNNPSSSYRASLQVSYLLRSLGTFMHTPECRCSLVIKAAFTLAEILVTLAIIGIIAALTLQPLIDNYKKLDTVTKLKKAYTTINQALKLSEAENGDYKNWESGIDLGATEFLNKYWLPYFNKSYKLCTSYSDCGYSSEQPWTCMNGIHHDYSLNGGRRRSFITTDGILYQISVAVGDSNNNSVSETVINIDVNGSKGPNIVGKDYFSFIRTDKNGILPRGYSSTEAVINSNCSTSGNGLYCAEKIRHAGWKIEDDYPW